MTRNNFPHYWICSECATRLGGKWPEGHVATLAEQVCKYCDGAHLSRGEMFTAPWVDYNWSDASLTKTAERMRD